MTTKPAMMPSSAESTRVVASGSPAMSTVPNRRASARSSAGAGVVVVMAGDGSGVQLDI